MVNFILCVHYDDEFRVTLCRDMTDDLPREGDILFLSESFRKPLMVDQVRRYLTKEKRVIEVWLTLDSIEEVKLFDEEIADCDPVDFIRELWNDGAWRLHKKYIDDDLVHQQLIEIVHS